MNVTLKEQILSLNQEKIYSLYFNLPISDINWSTQETHHKLHNPCRDDSTASLSFKWYGDKLIVRDFGDTRYSGDIFQVVGFIIGKNCLNGNDFVYICNDILDSYYKNKSSKNEEYDIIKKESKIVTIETQNRILQKRDYHYFKSYCILDKNVDAHVQAVMRYGLNGYMTGYRNSLNDPCYQYTINHRFTKLYFPFRHRKSMYPRFLTNSPLQIDDITDIKYCNDILLIKSIKDKMLLTQILDTLSITDICILTASSETSSFMPNILQLMQSKAKYGIHSMFDIDSTGLTSMKALQESTGIYQSIFSTNAKDPTDYAKQFGYIKSVSCFESVYKQIKERRKLI